MFIQSGGQLPPWQDGGGIDPYFHRTAQLRRYLVSIYIYDDSTGRLKEMTTDREGRIQCVVGGAWPCGSGLVLWEWPGVVEGSWRCGSGVVGGACRCGSDLGCWEGSGAWHGGSGLALWEWPGVVGGVLRGGSGLTLWEWPGVMAELLLHLHSSHLDYAMQLLSDR